MVLKIFGHPLSACTRRVVLVAKELDIPYEFVHIEFNKGEHKDPVFVEKMSPFGQVPAIDDDGLIIFDSRAISRYLAVKHGANTLVPKPGDLVALAAFEEGMAVELGAFEPFASVIVFEKVVAPLMGGNTDEAKLAKNLEQLEAKLDVYETILSKRKYLGGSEVTLADLNHIPYGAVMAHSGLPVLDNEKRPLVAQWWKDISSRKAWADTLASLA